MKSIIVASMLLSSLAFAQGPAAGGTAPAAPAAPAAEIKNLTNIEAKAACKAEGKKGKDMKACIKEKTM
jgi:hypothetical protein